MKQYITPYGPEYFIPDSITGEQKEFPEWLHGSEIEPVPCMIRGHKMLYAIRTSDLGSWIDKVVESGETDGVNIIWANGKWWAEW